MEHAKQFHEKDLERLQRFCLMDDDFISKCFEDNLECTELVVHIVLNRDDLKIQQVHTKHQIKNLQGRSIVLGIYAVDQNGNMCKMMEDMRKEADLQARISMAQNMIRDGKLPLEDIAKYSKLSLEEVGTCKARKCIRGNPCGIQNPGRYAERGRRRSCKVTIPTKWVKEMDLDALHRNVKLLFDGNRIILVPAVTGVDFAKQKKELGHSVYRLEYYDREQLCTAIYVDFTDEMLTVENYVEDPVKRAFGNNRNPSWEDFQLFLQERCLSKDRAGLREYLDTLGLAEYDPWEIIRITEGRMAEDHQWLRIEVYS